MANYELDSRNFRFEILDPIEVAHELYLYYKNGLLEDDYSLSLIYEDTIGSDWIRNEDIKNKVMKKAIKVFEEKYKLKIKSINPLKIEPM